MGVVKFKNFADEGVTGQAWIRDTTHPDGGQWGAYQAFPVGSIFFSAVATDPATLLGYGTWSAVGAGRVLVGYDAADSDFNTLGGTGGAKTSSHAHGYGTLTTDTITAHTHGAGSFQGDYEPDHAHGIGTLATVAESSHTHGYGTLATVAESSHTHGAGSLLPSAHSGTAVSAHSASDFNHKHDITTSGNATISAHTSHGHGSKTANLTAGSNPYYDTATTQGAHTLGGGTELADGASGPSVGHTVTQPSAHTMSGSTGAGSSHSHTMSGSTGAGSSHSHSMSGAPAAGGGHGHTVSGTSGSGGAHNHSVNSGATASEAPSVLQPYLVVRIWQRIA